MTSWELKHVVGKSLLPVIFGQAYHCKSCQVEMGHEFHLQGGPYFSVMIISCYSGRTHLGADYWIPGGIWFCFAEIVFILYTKQDFFPACGYIFYNV